MSFFRGRLMLVKGAYSVRKRFPTTTVFIEMALIVTGMGLVGYVMLPLVGH
jgi:hypothetical protein